MINSAKPTHGGGTCPTKWPVGVREIADFTKNFVESLLSNLSI
jgi:hypothetical protein